MTIQSSLPELVPMDRANETLAALRDYEITMVSAYHWYEEASWRVPWRKLPDTMLLAPVEGTLQVSLHQGRRLVKPDQVLVVPEGVSHTIQPAPGCERIEQVAIHCHVTSTWRPPLMNRFRNLVQPLAAPAYWHDQFRKLVFAMNTPALGQEVGALVIRSLLATWLLDGAALHEDRGAIDARVAQVLRRIHESFATDLSIAGLADEVALSTVQLRKLFRRHLHVSPKQYLLQHRLKSAARQLRTTSLTIKEIAYATGFNSEAYFHRLFGQTYRSTPRDYRLGRRQAV